MLKDIKSVKGLVELNLRDNPETRDSDIVLVLSVWESQGIYIPNVIQERILKHGHSPESIRRVRQQLQAMGWYEATDKSRRRRKKAAGEVKNWALTDAAPSRVETVTQTQMNHTSSAMNTTHPESMTFYNPTEEEINNTRK